MAMRVVGNEEGYGKTARGVATAMAMRVVSNKEGMGSKAMAKATRMASKQW
jgi:hypothetical protein